MPIVVKTCNCYNLMWVVYQKPDNHFDWPNKHLSWFVELINIASYF